MKGFALYVKLLVIKSSLIHAFASLKEK